MEKYKFNANLLDEGGVYSFYSKKHDAFINVIDEKGKVTYCSFNDLFFMVGSSPEQIHEAWDIIFYSIEKESRDTGRGILNIDDVDLIPVVDGSPDFTHAVDLHSLMGEDSLK